MHWKLSLSCSILASLITASVARADCNDPFAKPEEILDFHFKLSSADWRSLLASRIGMSDTNPAACMDQFPEFKAEFRCGTEGPFLKIALRKKKGEERGTEAFEKPPMKMDINEDFMGMVPEARGQRWPASFGDLGFRKLTLNNGQSNKRAGVIQVLPVLQSEHVTLRLLGKDVPESPRTAYAKVTMHLDGSEPGTYLGVYILIEDIDRTALRRRGFAGVGRLEKQSGSQCRPELQLDDGPPNEAKAAYDALVGKDPSQFPGRWLAEAAKGLDVDALLRQEAIREIVLNGQDTIFNSVNNNGGLGNNWYAYDPRVGLRHYIPWDVDLAFGQQQGNCDSAGAFMPPMGSRPLQCAYNMPLLSWCAGGRPYAPTLSRLGQRLACHTPEAQKRYLQIMCQLITGPLAADEIVKVWDQAFETLRPVVPLEQARAWKGVDPLADPPSASPIGEPIYETFGSEHRRLRSWIPQRINYLREAIGQMGVTCPATCQNGATDSCTYLGCASQRRCENGKWSACQVNTSCLQATPPPAPDGGTPPGTPDGGAPPPVGGSGPPPSGTGGAGGGGGAPAPTAGAPGGTAGAGGNAPSGGTGGRGGSGGTPPTMMPAGGGQAPDGGCQCEIGGARGAGSGLPLGFFLAALIAVSARRRRR
jgi:hypothetical protein